MDLLNQAAADVATAIPAESNAAVVQVSDAARNASDRGTGSGMGSGLERGLIDARIASYQVMASVRGIHVSDSMTQELLDSFSRR